MDAFHLIIVSGLSGSGKTVALHAMEDLGYYCVDNLPLSLLKPYVQESISTEPDSNHRVALGIDIRNKTEDLAHLEDQFQEIRSMGITCELFFLQADEQTLIKRFSESRRPHPLHQSGMTLEQALREERSRLEPLASLATLYIETSQISVHELRRQLWQRIGQATQGLSLLLESFAFKRGVPPDVDYVFDVRCLPNPHWEPDLRPLTGRDTAIRDYLGGQTTVVAMHTEIFEFLQLQIPRFEQQQRSYLTIGIGCTGGKHRSVFMVESLAKTLEKYHSNVLVFHRELP